MRTLARGLIVAAATVAVGHASAAPLTDVPTAFEKGNPFDFRARVSYFHDEARASLKREGEIAGQDQIGVTKDLLYAHSRDSMAVRLEAGIFHELGVFVELPFVLSDTTDYRFDQQLGAGCVYPGKGATPDCVNASNSSAVSDGIVPAGGYDATASAPGAPKGFPPGGDLVFRGPHRGGSGLDALDTLNLGINWAVLSQRRDDTKPTWVLGFEGQISFGNVMKFDRDRPDANHGISEGVHRLIFRTAVSRRFRYVEPFVGFWYQLPIARNDSLYIDYGNSQKNGAPQQSAGTSFGLEGIPYEKKESDIKVAIDLRGRIEAKFDGRGYSEGWELFASAPSLACDPKQNLACDPTMTGNANTKYQGQPFTGLTQIQDYAIFGADLAVTVQAGKHLRFLAGLEYARNEAHIITNDDVGQAFDSKVGNGCDSPVSGRVTRACEYNPAYRPVINQVGRRFIVDNLDALRVALSAQAMF